MTAEQKKVPVFRYIWGGISLLGFAIAVPVILWFILEIALHKSFPRSLSFEQFAWFFTRLPVGCQFLYIGALVAEVASITIVLWKDMWESLDKCAVGGTIAAIFAAIGLVIYSVGNITYLVALGTIVAAVVFFMNVRTEMFWRKKHAEEGFSIQLGSNPGVGMKWYKFLIYFALIASPILYGIAVIYDLNVFFQAVSLIGTANLELVLGLLMIILLYVAFGTLALVARYGLANYCSVGPKAYLTMILLSGALVLSPYIQMIVDGAELGLSFFVAVACCLVPTLVFFVLNFIYFKKREDLFDN